MHAEVTSHQQKGKQEAAHRLQEQVNLLEVSKLILIFSYRLSSNITTGTAY